jgi:hypothetical protein
VSLGSLATGCVVLFAVFLTFKLDGGIAWSWWGVTAPLLVLAAAGVAAAVRHLNRRRRLCAACERRGVANGYLRRDIECRCPRLERRDDR